MMWTTLIKSILPGLFSAFQSKIGLVLSYLKGRSDAKLKERLKADEQFIDRVAASKRAADAANSVPVDRDPNNRDR